MDDERIEHALKLGPVDEPAYRRGVRARIAERADPASPGPAVASADETPALAAPTRIDVHRRAGSDAARAARAPKISTLAQLAAVLAIVVVTSAVAVPRLIGGPAPSGDMLDRLRGAGTIRMVVPEGAPQTIRAGGVRIGFDVDVAHALADALALDADVIPVGVAPGPSSSNWDVSVGMPDLVTSAVSTPFAYWPAWVATDAGSGIRTVDELAGHPICIVGGTVAEDWVRTLASSAAGPQVVRTRSDDECIAALADGRADAIVTSRLFDDELEARGLVAVGTEPVAIEPRVIRIAATGEDTRALLAAIDAAIDQLRASGRLAELSRQSFGGRDLTEETP
jgi:ABC-type amino acid transport substrate-binding protein